MKEIETILKGGSLASTLIIDSGVNKIVRKKISLVTEREYGYYRWYSQLKKLQRLEKMFPNLFIKVLDFGYNPIECCAFMDLEYHEEAKNGYEYLKSRNTSEEEAKRFAHTILNSVEPLYQYEISSFTNAISLYFQEEIVSKINACMYDKKFQSDYDNTDVHELLEILKIKALECYVSPKESLTHGNLTLENILYIPSQDRILLIDLYEENVIDNKYNDYSQLAQSANSHYELLVEFGNEYRVPEAIIAFNEELKKIWSNKLNSYELNLIKFFECSQFFRMLPFKLKSGVDPLPYLKVAEKLTKEFINAT